MFEELTCCEIVDLISEQKRENPNKNQDPQRLVADFHHGAERSRDNLEKEEALEELFHFSKI